MTAPSSGIGAPLPRGERVGRYIVQQPLGAGGMGVVYEALDPELSRKVALKLLHREAASTELARTRLLREAQAMARLSHPNVVPVHDAGATPAGDVFVTMELVDGSTLLAWLRAEKRSWREVLHHFVLAGRGLAAAHDAALVHRDFKPDNVLVGKDGRVRVTDFGLVRSSPEPADPLAGTSTLETPRVDLSPTVDQLTAAGSLVGTPRYMSPEQLAALSADARSDQFAFCVALYESLYGEHPFPVDSLVSLVNAQRGDQVRPAPRDSEVPQWVRRAVVRGLKADPAQRHLSMQALLSALEADPAVKRRRLLLAGAWVGVAAASLAGVWAFHVHERGLCKGSERRLAGVWDPARRAALIAALGASDHPFAQRAVESVAEGLDRYAQAWIVAHRDICEATRIRGEVSEPLMQARMRCLDHRLAHLGSLVTQLSHKDEALLENGADMVAKLPEIGPCTRVTSRLSAAEVSHPDQEAKVREQIGRADALVITGRYADAASAARAAVEQAHAIGADALESEALVSEAIALEDSDSPDAEAVHHQALVLAERSGDDGAAFDAWQALAETNAYLAHPQQAIFAGSMALAKVDRGANLGTVEEANALSALGQAEYAAGQYDEAAKHLHRALALLPEGRRAQTLERIAHLLIAQDKHAEALALSEQALAERERRQGMGHPATGEALLAIGVTLHHLHRDDEAERAYLRAKAAFDAALGPNNVASARVLNNLAVMADDRNDQLAALELLGQARAIEERTVGPDNPSVANALVNEGTALVGLNRLEEARARYLRAQDILVRTLGKEHPTLVGVWTDLGTVEQLQHHDDEALKWLLPARALGVSKLGVDHPWLTSVDQALGEVYLHQGQALKAEELFRHALAIHTAHHDSDGSFADLRFRLAQAVWRVGRDRHGARELAQQALRDISRETQFVTRNEVVRWLANPR